jgi:hypothetical protein
MRDRAQELLLVGLCVVLISVQFLIPPFIGLANNGDYPKVLGRFSLGPEEGGWQNNFLHFVSDYARAPQYAYDGKLPSSEIALAAFAVSASRVAVDEFDIRWLGTVHALLFVAAFWIALIALRPYGRLVQGAVGAFALFVFTDVRYVSHFNSCYTDVPAMLGLGLMAGTALWVSKRYPDLSAVAFAASAVLFITSKAQHGMYGLLPVAFLLIFFRRSRAVVLCAAVLVLATVWMVTSTPRFYQGQALFNRIFFRILPNSPDPGSDARELGVLPKELRYVGMHSFKPGAPVDDPQWREGFLARTGYGKLLSFYLHHPLRTIKYLQEDLSEEAPQMRAKNLSNFRKEEGHAPGELIQRFGFWTALRTAALRAWPEGLIHWYLAVIAVCLRDRSRPAFFCLGLCALGILEFGVASLADTLETYRHLFIFHMITDLTICFAVAWAYAKLQLGGASRWPYALNQRRQRSVP